MTIFRFLRNNLFYTIFYLSFCSAEDTPSLFNKSKINFFSIQDRETLKDHLILKSALPKALYLIGHRGIGSTNILSQHDLTTIPENTLESFKQAILCGADGIEFDIFETRDGHLLIIHDDELWKNIHSMDRNGIQLPASETHLSFRVSQKDLSDLLKFSVGSGGQRPPVLSELFDLIEEANAHRQKFQMPPLLLNIDVKSSKVCIKCFECIEKYLQKNRETSINFSQIRFTSADPKALKDLYETAQLYHRSINTILQITTEQIYGKENTGENYLVKNPSQYKREYLDYLKKCVSNFHIRGIDCVLWDLNLPLLDVCKNEELELHLYVSDFKFSKYYQDLAPLIYSFSQLLPIYLKTDHLKEKLSILTRMDFENFQNVGIHQFFPLEKPHVRSNSLKQGE